MDRQAEEELFTPDAIQLKCAMGAVIKALKRRNGRIEMGSERDVNQLIRRMDHRLLRELGGTHRQRCITVHAAVEKLIGLSDERQIVKWDGMSLSLITGVRKRRRRRKRHRSRQRYTCSQQRQRSPSPAS